MSFRCFRAFSVLRCQFEQTPGADVDLDTINNIKLFVPCSVAKQVTSLRKQISFCDEATMENAA